MFPDVPGQGFHSPGEFNLPAQSERRPFQSGSLMRATDRTRSGVSQKARRLFRFTVLSRTVWLTAFGLGVVVMSVLLGAAAFNTGTNLLYLMLSMLFAIVTLSIGLGWINLNGLSVSRLAPGDFYAGRPGHLQVILKNRKRWMTSYGVSIEESLPDAEPSPLAAYFLSVPPRGAAVERQAVTFKRRGMHRFEGVRLGTIFPFGILEFRSRQADLLEVTVFPEIVPIDPPLRLLTQGVGDQEHPEKGHGSGLHSIREYMPGDAARDIHWKISAKGGGLKTREYESESSEGIQLVLNVARPELETEEDHQRLEKAISLTASLARHYLAEDIEVMLWTAAGTVPRGSGPAHLKRLLRSLALMDVEDLNPHRAPPAPPADMTQVRISGGGLEIVGRQRKVSAGSIV